MYKMDENLKRELILDNFKNPNNKGLINDKTYKQEKKSSSSCIDNFTIQLKLDKDIIKDIRFDGEACAIATSAISISIDKLIGKTKEEALDIINNYLNMIENKEFDSEKLEELIAYEDISKQPSRTKCATLGILGIMDLLKK